MNCLEDQAKSAEDRARENLLWVHFEMFRSGEEEETSLEPGLKIDRLKVGIGTREYFFPSKVDDFVFHVAADPGEWPVGSPRYQYHINECPQEVVL
jgi:hypothetical protein